jgi:Do/DeqQ family serine protease
VILDMHNGYFRKGAVAAIAAAAVSMAAWKAPQASSYLSAASSSAVVATAPAGVVPPAVSNASYAPVVDRVMPAVVTIRVEKKASFTPTDQQIPDELFRQFFGGQMPQMRGRRMPAPVERGLGSGVIVSKDGYILTNNHVVEGADKVRVDLPDHRTFSAKVIGTDPATDLAVVKIDEGNLPTLVVGDSDAVKVGDVVLAIGNPLNVGETVTSGIISAKGRTTPGGDDSSYEDFLQTDAAINHGNSGGALVNVAGELIGINSQILSPSDGNIGLGFAIPSNMAKHVMDELVTNGSVRRAKMGVTIQGISPDMAQAMNLSSTRGALVSSVESGSPAEKAGLKQGDVITQFNGKDVADNNQLRNTVANTLPGTKVPVTVLRDGRTETFDMTLGELAGPKTRAPRGGSAERGSEGKFGMGLQADDSGVVVAQLDPNGIAAESGLREGDVITKVDGKTVKSPADVKAALDRQDGKPSLVVIERDGQALFLTLRAE